MSTCLEGAATSLPSSQRGLDHDQAPLPSQGLAKGPGETATTPFSHDYLLGETVTSLDAESIKQQLSWGPITSYESEIKKGASQRLEEQFDAR